MPYRNMPEHNSKNYLKAILESIEYYNAFEREDISRWLYEGYKKAEDIKNRKTTQKAVVLELISKWIQLLEDLAVLCLMFAGSDLKYRGNSIVPVDKEPFEIYTFTGNQTILKFYSVARRKLSKKVIYKIYGLKTARQLLSEKVINPREYSFFVNQIELLYQASLANLNKIGKLYSDRSRGGRPSYGKLVETYFKTKHSFKVLHATPTTNLLWSVQDSDLILVKKVARLRSNRKVMTVALFSEFREEDVLGIVEQIHSWTKVVISIVGAQLRSIDDPNYFVAIIRKIKTDEILARTGSSVGRNDPCPCESGKKYKKCCG